MSIAQNADYRSYPDFNSFFTRALTAEARPISKDDNEIICPVDGTISQFGNIEQGRLLQAKGIHYQLGKLVGGSKQLSDQFVNGKFITLYLSPRDYHRIHMPMTGTLKEMQYLPGRLYSVSRYSTSQVRGLFTRNERLVVTFDTTSGPMVIILIGAIFVSGIETVWQKTIPAKETPDVHYWNYNSLDNPLTLQRGDEMGRFNMGSTVIVLFNPHQATLATTLAPDQAIQMGQAIGNIMPGN